MRRRIKAIWMLLFMACLMTQSVFGDVVVGPRPGQKSMGLLLVVIAILAIWAISFAVIKEVRNRNVNK